MKRISASPLFTQHFNREKVYFLGRLHRFVGCTTLGATTAQPALLSPERAQSLPGGIAETEGYEGEHQKMLDPERHSIQVKN